jgi:ElaB/YqjD/DUF883 family membrane-anchored ribosome-binding protein
MADESAAAQSPQELQSELDQSRESAARLMESLARKLGATTKTVRKASGGVHRAAHYVQVHSAKDMAAELERLVRRRPAYSIAAAVVAGFLVGRALRSR